MSTTQPMQGITVVEVGHTVAAPYAGMILAELGADVIKVESPDGGDYSRGMPPYSNGKSAVYQALNRNKRSIAINMADPAQGCRLREFIVGRADVLLHNLKFGAMAKLGFDAAGLLREKPGLVYCNVGAFGAKGPLRNKPGYDPLVQAFSGLMSIMGEDGRPPVRVGVSITDMAAGLWAVIGIQAACLEKQRTGRGGVVDTSLFETALGWLAYHFSSYFASGVLPRREGSGLAQIVPYQAFAARDAYVMVAAGNDSLFRKLCGALQRDDLAMDIRFATNKDRVANRAELIARLEQIFATETAAHWLTVLAANDVPCSPINTLEQVIQEPQTQALGILQTSPDGSERLLGLPLMFDGERPAFRRGAPGLGEHNSALIPVNGSHNRGERAPTPSIPAMRRKNLQILRSLMFTPGQRRNMIDKAMGLGDGAPDALMFDFEDSVPPDQKDMAREHVSEALERPLGQQDPVRIVRVNSSATGRQIGDMRAVVGPTLFAILLPKVETRHEVLAAAMVLDDLERGSGLERGRIGLIAAIESARGIHSAVDIATSSPRLRGLMFGAEDYARDLGLPVVRTGAAWDLVFARSTLVNAAAIARLFTVDQVHMDFRDAEAERRDAMSSRQLGFSGKAAIHPSQIPILNEVFSPTQEEVEHARRVLAAFADARTRGLGCVMMGGQVVEQPILERAEQVVRLHEAVSARDVSKQA